MTPDENRRRRVSAEVAQTGVTRMPPAKHHWRAPVGVRLVNDDLVYDWKATEAKGGTSDATPGLLEDFLALHEAAPEAFVEFAQDHGVLGLCEHAFIYTDCPVADGIDNPSNREPLQQWRHWVRHARVIADAAGRLHGAAARPLPSDLRHELYEAEPQDELPRGLHADRQGVASALSRWLFISDARVVVSWEPRTDLPALTIGSMAPDRGVFAALGLQLAMLAGRAEGLATCSGCGALFSPTRRPRSGVRAFCAACRAASVPVKLAARDSRARKAQSQEDT